jgi:hypothetical protein
MEIVESFDAALDAARRALGDDSDQSTPFLEWADV